MVNQQTNFNIFFINIFANSLFTERQISIISNRLTSKNIIQNVSRGAYHRQLKQCRDKVVRHLYSMLLLESIGALDDQTLSVLGTLADQIAVMSEIEERDIHHERDIQNVICTMNEIIRKMCNV
jgi:hypothetical protein